MREQNRTIEKNIVASQHKHFGALGEMTSGENQIKLFFVVLAKTAKHLPEKIKELEVLGHPYVIVCGERVNHRNVVYRTPKGKYDAINFAAENLLPKGAEVIAFNDVDTKNYNIQAAFRDFRRTEASVLFAKIKVKDGPQVFFNTLIDTLKRKILVSASGELILIRRDILDSLLPLKPCKAEDTYILFKVLEHGHKAVFCEDCYLETVRTKSPKEEESYKRRTVAGIYQALSYTNPPPLIKLFYILLPMFSPLLLVLGANGYHVMRGIILGFNDFIRGDRGGSW